ncbi:MAG: ABC transporter substrate-binding protein [Castellaniella sp.]|uniref:ABC transporter substrate-binding protein n=1 Tax=Castellaniella sp. TaxID=1955812 RepID=UPI003C77B007
MQSRAFPGQSRSGQPFDSRRRQVLLAGALGVPALSLMGRSAFAANGKNSVSLAMIGEPQTLDPMFTTADLVGTLMQHVYEPLYTFDSHWRIVPMLAAAMPTVLDGGKQVDIPLRKGLVFHDGKPVQIGDVVASLKRWMEVSPRGKSVAAEVVSVEAASDSVLTFKLKSPYAPLLAQLALPTSMAAVMPASTIAAQLTEFIGTGPYRLKERRPDQYTILEKFDQYAARTEAPDGYGGRRIAYIQELRFIPVPDSNTRVEGVLSGQFDFADLLPTEAAGRLEQGGKQVVPLIGKNFGFPYLVFNTKGTLDSAALRQTAQAAIGAEELMAAAFGDPKFFSIGANFFPQGTPYYSLAGQERYNVNDPKKAAELAKKAGYAGKPIRILASRQYEFHYNMALVLSEQFKRAGLEVDLQVVDWATLLQRRNDPSLWDIYITHSGIFPEPMLSPPQLGDNAPGWWETPEKKAVLDAFNREMDLSKRGPLWGTVQELVYEQVPFIELGKFNSLSARSAKLQGYNPSAWPAFWNVKLA